MMISLFCAYLTRFCTNPLTFSVQVKPSKRAKKNKPAEESVLTEPEASAPEPPSASAPETTTAPSDEQVMEGSDNPETPARLIQMIRTL